MECMAARCDLWSQDLESDFKFITVKRSRFGYGFNVQLKDETIDSPNDYTKQDIFVVKDIPQKNTKNGLMIDDEILSFNGTSARHLKQTDIKEILKYGQGDIDLIIRRKLPMHLPDDGYHSYSNIRCAMSQESDLQPTQERQYWNITL